MPWWSVSLRGVAMGAADVVPGVSGGTMALVLGIYPRFIAALTQIDPDLVRRTWSGVRGPDRWRRIWQTWQGADVPFLMALGLGIGVAILSLSKIIPNLLQRYPAEMNGLFFGMIAVSVVVPVRLMRERGLRQALAFGLAGAVAYGVTGLQLMQVQGGLAFLFVSGAIAISAMLLPGISGSFLLLIMGQYSRILEAIHERDLPVLAVFGIGVLVGLFTFSRVLKWLLLRHPSTTLAALAGLMVGSLRKIWPYQAALDVPVKVGDKVVRATENVWPGDSAYSGSVWMPLILAVVGATSVWALDRIGRSRVGDL